MRRIKLLILGALLLAGGVLPACQDPWTSNDPHTQFDRYALLRGQKREEKRTDRFGGEEVNLRERLRPLSDQP